MRICTPAVLTTAFLLALTTLPRAASLQVAPVSVEVAAPGATATVNLRNEGKTPLNAQIRIFRWSQVNGEEKLEPTIDVVASPPMASLAPSTDYVVRLVRVNKQPVIGSETYRLLIDEVPDAATRKSGVVNLVLRYSVPVFFYPPTAAGSKLSWSVEQRGNRVVVSASNSGDRHVRVSALKVSDGSSKAISFGDGLTGYVLGRSTMRWAAPGNLSRLGGKAIQISAQGDQGPINGQPSAHPPR